MTCIKESVPMLRNEGDFCVCVCVSVCEGMRESSVLLFVSDDEEIDEPPGRR